ncbi:MAG: hypothetical protein K0A99_00015 [Desulfoarculaceae bacterium]|nr:hypothetical protein [Desulfoarculaceae bacterium]
MNATSFDTEIATILAVIFCVLLIAYFALKALIKVIVRLCYPGEDVRNRIWLLTAYLLMFVSLFLDWGVKKFWIFTWGHSNFIGLIAEIGWIYVILIIGWIYPLIFYLKTGDHLRKMDVDVAVAHKRFIRMSSSQFAASEFAALRIYTAFNMSAPFVVGFVQSLLSRQLLSGGAFVYWIASVILFIAVERIVWQTMWTQELQLDSSADSILQPNKSASPTPNCGSS